MKFHGSLIAMAACGATLLMASGCATARPSRISDEQSVPPRAMHYQCGEELEIVFFGAPELNTTQLVRRDGYISLRLIGDIKAAGQTPDQLAQALRAAYAQQLQIKDIAIVLRNPAPVLVGGEVIHPGRVSLTRPMTVLEAIVEAGGFDLEDAELREVMLVRTQGNRQQRLVFDMHATLYENHVSTPFYLEPFDVIHVPRRWDR